MGIKSNLTLLSNASASGTPVSVPIGGRYAYAVAGTFGGATTQLQILGPDGTTFMNVPSSSHTAAGYVSVDLPAGASVKAIITGGTPSAMWANLSLVEGA